MEIIPAIDLREGKCVRLIQGRYDRQITYQDDPVAQAKSFHDAGATWLHVVDLDGAKLGRPVNTRHIEAITSKTEWRVEVGGGLRDEEAIREMLKLGVQRVIIGTQAVHDFGWFSRMAEIFRDRLVLGLDARGSTVATHGWQKDSQRTLVEFAQEAAVLPLAAIIYTDIARDGMLCGPNIERTRTIAEAVHIPVIASGGVSNLDDVRQLDAVEIIDAVIAGRSLYEGTLDLKEAIAATKHP